MSSEVVRYRVDEETVAQFEIEPVEGFRPAGAGDIAGAIKEAAGPALAAAQELLRQVEGMGPDSVQVKFGIKVTGTAKYIDDLSFPGMLYGRTVRSTIPRGAIRSLRRNALVWANRPCSKTGWNVPPPASASRARSLTS